VEEWRVWLKSMMRHDLQDARRRFVDAQRRDMRRERSLEAGERPTHDVSDPAPSPRASLIAAEESAALQEALARLPEDYRLVLRLRNWDCLPFAEVGQRMDRTEEAARKLWSRAIVRLQEEFPNPPG
jgi:RNA polymerase sigma-70 factor (ECF subfamily)